jgi:hypothetical protein
MKISLRLLAALTAAFFIAPAQAQQPGPLGAYQVFGNPSASPSLGRATDPSKLGLAPYETPQKYGAKCDGVTDDHTALQSLLTAAAGKAIFIPAGSDCLTSTTLNVPSNTSITGGGRELANIKATTCTPIFTITNQLNIAMSNFGLKGSDACVSWVSSNFGAMQLIQNGASTGINYSFQNMKFSGFNSTYWIYVSTVGSTASLSNFTFSDNLIQTVPADAPTDPANGGNWGLVMFTATGGNGRIENTIIKNNRIDATYMCIAVNLYSNHYKFDISGNVILNAGQSNANCVPAGTRNSYAILLYDLNADGFTINSGTVNNNIIISPYASGIYMAGGGYVSPGSNDADVMIANNFISGQTSKDDATLPRGGISINGFSSVNVKGNTLMNGFGGIVAVAQTTSSAPVVIQDNTCKSFVINGSTSASCIRIGPGVSGANTVKYIIKGNYLELTDTTVNGGSVIRSLSGTGFRYNDLEISDNTINAGLIGLDFTNQWVGGSLIIKNNKFGGVANSKMMDISALSAGNAAIIGNVFDGVAGVNGNGLIASAGTIQMTNNKFMNRASGSVAMFSAISTCGTISGMQFNNVVQAAQVAATSLGTANPSGCSLNYLDFVQNLAPVSGAGLVWGWLHSSTTTSTTHQALAFP